MTAQGEALGLSDERNTQALKGRNHGTLHGIINSSGSLFRPYGAWIIVRWVTWGFTPGSHIMGFQPFRSSGAPVTDPARIIESRHLGSYKLGKTRFHAHFPPRERVTICWASSTMRVRCAWSLKLSA